MKKLTPIIILCEGASEKSYISELSRYLREKESSISLVPQLIGTGHFIEVRKSIKSYKKQNKNDQFIVWLDFDLYKRPGKDSNLYNKDNYQNVIKFSNMNFEDFLTLHLPKEQLLKWERICKAENHFQSPLPSETHLPMFKANIFYNYNKGTLFFKICDNTMSNFISNCLHLKTELYCSFAEWLIKNICTGLNIFSSFSNNKFNN